MGMFMSGNNISTSSRNGVTKVTVNGKTTTIQSSNVSVINGSIYVDGKKYKAEGLEDIDKYGTVNVSIEGNVGEIKCSGSVTVKGDVTKGVDCGGSVNITGNVDGKVDCGGSCKIEGGHKGRIDAGGSVSII